MLQQIQIPDQNQSEEMQRAVTGLREIIGQARPEDRFVEITKRLFQHDLLHPTLPRANGGRDLSVVALADLIRLISQESASAATTMIGNLLGYTALRAFARPSLHARVVQDLLARPMTLSFAMTEAAVGSDLQRIRTRAQQVEDGWLLSGEKNFITNGSRSAHLTVFARAFAKDGRDLGISCFYISGEQAGLSRGKPLEKIGWCDADTAALHLKDVFVADENLVGTPGQGLDILGMSLSRSKTLLAAMGVGLSERAMRLAHERMGSTERFGRSLSQQPAIKHKLALAEMRIESAWLMALWAASTWDLGRPAVREASMAKRLSGEVAVETCSMAMELFGARGFLQEYEVSRLWAEAKAIEIIEGPSLVQELLIAKHSRFAVQPAPTQVANVRGVA